MIVKCPKCRFKFDGSAAIDNESHQVNCVCPRCGHAFIASIQPSSTPAEEKQEEPKLVESDRTEAELYFTAVKCLEEGLPEEARALVSVLLRMNPSEAMYIGLKDKLDGSSGAKTKQSASPSPKQETRPLEVKPNVDKIQLEAERYKKALEYMSKGHYSAAQTYVTKLLEMSPNNPRYMELDRQIVRKKTSTFSGNSSDNSGCMIVIIAIIISLASIFAF